MFFSEIQNYINNVLDDIMDVLPRWLKLNLSKITSDWWGLFVQPNLDATDKVKDDLKDVGFHSLLCIIRETAVYLPGNADMEENEVSDLVDSLDEMESAWSSPTDIARFTLDCILADLDDLHRFGSFIGNLDIIDEVDMLISKLNNSAEIEYDTEALLESIDNLGNFDFSDPTIDDIGVETNGRFYDSSEAFDLVNNSLTALHTGVKYGSNALNIYDKCCKDLGWDSSLRGRFKKGSMLFAPHATAYGQFGVWFIAVSNCDVSEDVISQKKHRVHYYGNLIRVEDDDEKNLLSDETPEYRLTFVKRRATINEMDYFEDMYYYAGIYCCEEVPWIELDTDSYTTVSEFHLISGTETFPSDLSEEDENMVMKNVSAKNHLDGLKSFAIPEDINKVREFGRIHEEQSLRYLVSYGSDAGRIYRACVGRKAFSWEYVDEKLIEFMRKTGYIFFPQATNEGFDVWFISGSNINHDEEWVNNRPKRCYVHKNSVVEVDSRRSSKAVDVEGDGRYRLVFVKKDSEESGSKYGDYVYYGVFYLTYVYRDRKSGELMREFTRIREYDTYYGKKCRGSEKTNCPVCGARLFTEIIGETANKKAIMQSCEKCDTEFVEIIDL